MVCKADVLLWFKDLESYERIDLMHELLTMCLPFEVRFLGGCVEELGKHSFQELRGPSIIANDTDKLTKDITQLAAGLLDRNCRHRMCVYLSLLENRNCQCAHWYFKQVFRTEQFDEFAMRQKCDDVGILNELLMVFTLGRLHPAFNYHQKEFFSEMLDRLYRIKADKSVIVKNSVSGYPPGFGYPSPIVPYDGYVTLVYDQLLPLPLLQPQQQQQLAPPPDAPTAAKAPPSGDLATPPPPPPGLPQPQPPPPPHHSQHQGQHLYHHPHHYEHVHLAGWRQQQAYGLPDHMMAPPPPPPPQPVSPPPSRPSSPTTPASSKSSSLESPSQQQQHRSNSSPQQEAMGGGGGGGVGGQLRMPSATLYVTPVGGGGGEGKLTENECNHMLTDDKSTSTATLLSHQDWAGQLPPPQQLQQHLPHLPPQHHFTFAPPLHHQMAPQNGLRHCFAANYHPHHHGGGGGVIAMDQHQVMYNYELEYQQQHYNELQLDNALHRSGSSSNNSSNASSLNQSPPDTPASTPTPAHHGPGRGNRDIGLMDITEKIRGLSNLNGMHFMTPPPPPINDGNLAPPQPQTFTYNVPYTGMGGARQVFSRVPAFTHSFPPPLTQQQQQQQQQQLGQPQLLMFALPSSIQPQPQPQLVSANGNVSQSNSVCNTASTRQSLSSCQTPQTAPIYNSAGGGAAGALSSSTTSSGSSSAGGGGGGGPAPCPSSSSASSCGCCCNCGSLDHADADCAAAHIDDITQQAAYTLDYDDASAVANQVQGSGVGQVLDAPDI